MINLYHTFADEDFIKGKINQITSLLIDAHLIADDLDAKDVDLLKLFSELEKVTNKFQEINFINKEV